MPGAANPDEKEPLEHVEMALDRFSVDTDIATQRLNQLGLDGDDHRVQVPEVR